MHRNTSSPVMQKAKADTRSSTPSQSNPVTSLILEASSTLKALITSNTTQKAVISGAALAALVITSLIGAVVAYTAFYYLYIPQKGFSREVFLQYGCGLPQINAEVLANSYVSAA